MRQDPSAMCCLAGSSSDGARRSADGGAAVRLSCCVLHGDSDEKGPGRHLARHHRRAPRLRERRLVLRYKASRKACLDFSLR